jgi:hypothetical protein
MYVTSVHGRVNTSDGTRYSSRVTPDAVCCTKNMRTVAMRMRSTQGVT